MTSRLNEEYKQCGFISKRKAEKNWKWSKVQIMCQKLFCTFVLNCDTFCWCCCIWTSNSPPPLPPQKKSVNGQKNKLHYLTSTKRNIHMEQKIALWQWTDCLHIPRSEKNMPLISPKNVRHTALKQVLFLCQILLSTKFCLHALQVREPT